MSRFLTRQDDGSYLEELESMDVCRWRIDGICYNVLCDCFGDCPYPSSICESNRYCEHFEKEDGIID